MYFGFVFFFISRQSHLVCVVTHTKSDPVAHLHFELMIVEIILSFTKDYELHCTWGSNQNVLICQNTLLDFLKKKTHCNCNQGY